MALYDDIQRMAQEGVLDFGEGVISAAKVKNTLAGAVDGDIIVFHNKARKKVGSRLEIVDSAPAAVGSKAENGVGSPVTNILTVTQAEYDALTPSTGTLYLING